MTPDLEQRYEISLRTILMTIGVLALVWVIIRLGSLFIALFIALIISLALEPLVVKLCRRRIPRPLGVILVFITVAALVGTVVAYSFSSFITQFGIFLIKLPSLLEPFVAKIWPLPLTEQVQAQLFSQLTTVSTGLLDSTLNLAVTIASNAGFILQVLFFTLYLLFDWPNVKSRFVGLFNRPTRQKMEDIIVEVEHKLGGWVRGQFILMVIVGLLSFVGLVAFGVDYALPLALIAGVLEVVPMVGPVVSAIPAVIVGFSSSVWLGVGVLILYIVIQQVENSVIVPQVMKKAIGFSPLTTLIILFAGGEFFGFGGVVLALPTALFLSAVARKALNWNAK